MAITPAMAFWMMTSRSRDAIDEMVGSLVGKSMALWVPADMWSRHGVEHPLGPSFTGLQDLLPQHIDEQTAIDYLDPVPPSLVREVCLCGTPAEIVDQISERRDHGLRYAVLMTMSAVHPKVSVGLRSFIPVVQVLRGLKRL
jgi:phthiodiolone/phenolphthiodiolone dimycocerosates ketoreductase